MEIRDFFNVLFLLAAGLQSAWAQHAMQVWHDGKCDLYYIDGAPAVEIERAHVDITYSPDKGTEGHEGESYDNLFDDDAETKWCCPFEEGNTIYTTFTTSYPVYVTGYQITTGSDTDMYPGRNPKSWNLYGYDTSHEPLGSIGVGPEKYWRLIASVSNDTTLGNESKKTYTYMLPSETTQAYSKFKWLILGVGNDENCQVSEFRLIYNDAVIRKDNIFVDSVKFVDINLDEISTVLATDIQLSQKYIEIEKDETELLTATVVPDDAKQSVIWTSSDSNVATVNANGVVTAIDYGYTEITAMATDGSGVYAKCHVNVIEKSTYDTTDNHEWVDLGLPSGTLWATCNIGSLNAVNYGSLFAWGETMPKIYCTWTTYRHCHDYALEPTTTTTSLIKYCSQSEYGYNGFTDNLTELLPEDDAATILWGEEWQIPSYGQFAELINDNYTTKTWAQQNNIYGIMITSNINGNSVFLSATGFGDKEGVARIGEGGSYWTRNLAPNRTSDHSIHFGFLCEEYFGLYSNYRCYGRSIRPVRKQ